MKILMGITIEASSETQAQEIMLNLGAAQLEEEGISIHAGGQTYSAELHHVERVI